MEAVCFQVRDILEAMNEDCGSPLHSLKVDGGMTKNELLLQIQADLIGIDVMKPEVQETTALGVALAAYKGINPDYSMKLANEEENIKVIKSKIKDYEKEMRYKRWKMAIERSFGWDSTHTERNLDSP